MSKFIRLAATTIGLTALAFGASAVLAATPKIPTNEFGEALEIAPPVVTLTADSGQTITTQIQIRSASGSRLLVKSAVNDFTAAGEDGTPKVLLDADETEPNPYSLKTWISPLQDMILEPKQIKALTVTIHVPARTAPGGYYGVIRFTATPPELKDTGVSLSASLGSLVFLRINGQAKEGLELQDFTVSGGGHTGSLFESVPLEFAQRLKNTGNTNLQPAGQVTIPDMFGQKIANVNVNLPPRYILPQTTRKFTEPLDSSVIGDKFLFGQYTASLKLTYGDNKQEVTSSITFWVIPYRLIGFILLGLVITFFGLRYLIKRYNRNIVRRSQGGGLRMGGKRK
jgi:hypothetical protein